MTDENRFIDIDMLNHFGENAKNFFGGSSYSLPVATTETLGGVKVDGNTINIDSNGVISAKSGNSAPIIAKKLGEYIAPTNSSSGGASITITLNDDMPNYQFLAFSLVLCASGLTITYGLPIQFVPVDSIVFTYGYSFYLNIPNVKNDTTDPYVQIIPQSSNPRRIITIRASSIKRAQIFGIKNYWTVQ